MVVRWEEEGYNKLLTTYGEWRTGCRKHGLFVIHRISFSVIEKIEFNEEQYNKALPLIKAQLKALIARDLWDMNEYFQVMNANNKSVERALEILNDKEYEKILK